MSDSIKIRPLEGPLDAVVRPPGSKSITNRALVCAALARGTSTLTGALESEDTQVMIVALSQMGIAIEERDGGQTLVVTGCEGQIPQWGGELQVANSGTTIRFLTSVAALGQGTFRLDGIARMRERPIADLLSALGQLGASARSEQDNGCPPVIVQARRLPGGKATVAGDISSQFLSSLLMAAPLAKQPVQLKVEGPLVSQPYVKMTLRVMEAFGVKVEASDMERVAAATFAVPNKVYQAADYAVEPDASAASYFWAAAAIAGGRVCVEGLSRESLQGDVAFCERLDQMGCRVEYADDSVAVTGGALTGIDVDMNGISDTVQTLAAVALFAKGPTRIRGVAHIRHKETDRIADLATELRKLGATVDEYEDGLTITPDALRAATIDTYNDHRMAMSLSLVGLKVPGVVINDPGCTAKTHPKFFEDLAGLTK